MNKDPRSIVIDYFNKIGKPELLDTVEKLASKSVDNPPLVFCWKNVCEFVAVIPNADAVPGAPNARPMNLVGNVTVQLFKDALLAYVNAATVPIASSIVPCDAFQYGDAIRKLSIFEYDTWTQHVLTYARANGIVVSPIATLVMAVNGSAIRGPNFNRAVSDVGIWRE
jgi:hypothetical protein